MPSTNNPPNPADWIEANFNIPETDDHKLHLAPYQYAVLNEALRRESGLFVYSTVVWGDIKKSIKSTIAAAVVKYRSFQTAWGSYYIVANDLKQADSRIAYYLRRSFELNADYSHRAKIKPSGYLVELDNHTRIEAIPVDPKGEAGANPDGVFYSELWGANQKAALRMWTETTLSPTKYGQSQRWVETYAGFSGESPLLEQLYESGVKQGRPLDLSYTDKGGVFHDLSDVEVFANDAARLLCLWNTKPRLEWQSNDYYAQEAAVLTPDEFQRVHRNQWVTSTNRFIATEWWDACKGDVPPLEKGEAWVLGVDAAVSHDSFAIVGVSRRKDTIYPRFVKVWTPPRGGKIEFAQAEAELRRLVATYNIACITYDPMQLEDMMQRFSSEKLVWCHAFQQGAPRLEADTALYQRIMRRGIVHDGDPVLREHLQNADADIDQEGHKMRIVHRAPHLFMDAAVALSQACAIASEWNLG